MERCVQAEVPPQGPQAAAGEQQGYEDDQLLDGGKTGGQCSFTSWMVWPWPLEQPSPRRCPPDEGFKALHTEPRPSQLSTGMKPQDLGSSASEQAARWEHPGPTPGPCPPKRHLGVKKPTALYVFLINTEYYGSTRRAAGTLTGQALLFE